MKIDIENGFKKKGIEQAEAYTKPALKFCPIIGKTFAYLL
ncbi:MAG: hypothetical protein ACJAZ4_002258 [Neptuniibacter pectenicola]|jgi:hypothetical protein|tara:strand:+ start:2900 stop:3019 length:120 start_codon:yes stop_codon:yes gene_type:complete